MTDNVKLLTFLVPIRHPATVPDWNKVKQRLSETIRSLKAQTSDNWNAIIVANHEADLPPLPANFSVVRIGMAPPPVLPAGADQDTFYEHFRADKGRRVLAGLVQARPSGFVMTVDYDDFVSNKLAAFVAQHPQSNGWYVEDGYLYDGSRILLRYPKKFNEYCGTCLIIRADLLRVPSANDEATENYIRRWLGSHRFIDGDLERDGTPLRPLPFPGSIYRIGYTGAHSGSKGIRKTAFPRWLLKRQPLEFARRLLRLRVLNSLLLDEFFGGNHGERVH